MSHSNVRTLSWFNLAHLLDKDGHQFGLHAEDSLPAARPITNHLQRVTIAAVATPYNLIREAFQTSLTGRGHCIASLHSMCSFNAGNEGNIVIFRPNQAQAMLVINMGILIVSNWTRFNEKQRFSPFLLCRMELAVF